MQAAIYFLCRGTYSCSGGRLYKSAGIRVHTLKHRNVPLLLQGKQPLLEKSPAAGLPRTVSCPQVHTHASDYAGPFCSLQLMVAFPSSTLKGCMLGFCGLSMLGLNYQDSSYATSGSSGVVWYWIALFPPLQLHPPARSGCRECHSLSLRLEKILTVQRRVHLLASETGNQTKPCNSYE